MATTYPDVIPMIAYENGPAAMDWLSSAFGFTERARMLGKDGRLSHGEMQAGDGVIMLATPSPDYQAPRRHRAECEPAQKWSRVPFVVDGVLVYVDDIDKHFQRARQKGATILSEPEANDYGKLYRAEDLEGHRWMFMQRA
jgi:PhnB protein